LQKTNTNKIELILKQFADNLKIELMYATRIRKPLRLMDFPGRIPLLTHLWGCLRIYLKMKNPIQEEGWDVIDVDDYGEWGLYDIESKKWIIL